MARPVATRGGQLLGPGLLTLANVITVAAPVAYWAPFLLAPLVPGTTIEDQPHPVPRLAGLPVNVLGAAATTATAAAGWLIDRRSTVAGSR